MSNEQNQASLMPNDAERQQREERILAAAATLLVRWGYRKTTIDDVAREAGVGKGTIYLHWTDKQTLFLAAIWHQQRKVAEIVKQRIAADPIGGLFHRWITHSIVAALDNPLTAALIQGRSDIFNGVVGAYDRDIVGQMVDDFDATLLKLQAAGLIRSDLPAPTTSFLITALKIGIISAPSMVGDAHTPTMAELTEAISDLMQRWLEPEGASEAITEGKHLARELIDQIEQYDHIHQRRSA